MATSRSRGHCCQLKIQNRYIREFLAEFLGKLKICKKQALRSSCELLRQGAWTMELHASSYQGYGITNLYIGTAALQSQGTA